MVSVVGATATCVGEWVDGNAVIVSVDDVDAVEDAGVMDSEAAEEEDAALPFFFLLSLLL